MVHKTRSNQCDKFNYIEGGKIVYRDNCMECTEEICVFIPLDLREAHKHMQSVVKRISLKALERIDEKFKR